MLISGSLAKLRAPAAGAGWTTLVLVGLFAVSCSRVREEASPQPAKGDGPEGKTVAASPQANVAAADRTLKDAMSAQAKEQKAEASKAQIAEEDDPTFRDQIRIPPPPERDSTPAAKARRQEVAKLTQQIDGLSREIRTLRHESRRDRGIAEDTPEVKTLLEQREAAKGAFRELVLKHPDRGSRKPLNVNGK